MTSGVWLINEGYEKRYVIGESIDDAIQRYRKETNLSYVNNIRMIDGRVIIPNSAEVAQIELRQAAAAEAAQAKPSVASKAESPYR